MVQQWVWQYWGNGWTWGFQRSFPTLVILWFCEMGRLRRHWHLLQSLRTWRGAQLSLDTHPQLLLGSWREPNHMAINTLIRISLSKYSGKIHCSAWKASIWVGINVSAQNCLCWITDKVIKKPNSKGWMELGWEQEEGSGYFCRLKTIALIIPTYQKNRNVAEKHSLSGFCFPNLNNDFHIHWQASLAGIRGYFLHTLLFPHPQYIVRQETRAERCLRFLCQHLDGKNRSVLFLENESHCSNSHKK